MKKEEYAHVCHWCLYRHGGCDRGILNKIQPCPEFRIGKCFKCKYCTIDPSQSAEALDAWFRRGCETWYPSGCKKYKGLKDIPYALA